MKKWLERLGLRPKKSTPVGTQLEHGGSDVEDTRRRDLIVRTALLAVLVLGTLAAFPRGEVFEYTVQVGDTWRQPTLVAPFNFPIYKDSDQVRSERERARRTTPPYFAEVLNPEQVSQAHRDTLQQQVNEALDAYTDSRMQRLRDNREQAENDSTRYVQLRRNARVTLSPEQWEVLTRNALRHMPEQPNDAMRAPPGEPRMDRQLMQAVGEVSGNLQRRGVIDIPLDSVYTDHVIVRNEEERIQRRISVDRLVGIEEAFRRGEEQLSEQFDDRPDAAQIAVAFFRDTFEPVYRYQEVATQERRDQRAQNVSPISGGVERGEVIVQQGERVTAEAKQKLTSLEREKNQRAATTIVWRQLSGELVLVMITFLFFFGYLYLVQPTIWKDNGTLMLVALLFGLGVALSGIVIRLADIDLYVVPVALISVTMAIVLNVRIALFGTLVLAFLGGQMLGMNLQYTLAAFIGGALGVFSVRDIKNRGQFLLSALLVFVGYALVIIGTWLFLGTPAARLGNELTFAAIGASFTIVAQPILWLIERAFGITTDLTLLELSDTNRPLLKQLSIKAPGTFNHSMQVANLAEAAADRIGANGLLIRVGALYHDIGKMIKPNYFVENQRGGKNPHDDEKPRISAMVITRHVKEGLKMGRKENLPDQVLQFIATHHGTARVEYFYQKAIQEAENESQVNASDFRYPGPRPFSKETGILLLADSVEAACRSLDDPSESNLRKLVESIFQRHIETGQLDDTDLTFKEISTIKAQFMQMLTGVYHSRVKYPGQEEEEPVEEESWIAPTSFDEEEDVSVVWKKDSWHAGAERVSSDELEKLPGVHIPRAVRPEVAETSIHGSGNGAHGQAPMLSHPASDIARSGNAPDNEAPDGNAPRGKGPGEEGAEGAASDQRNEDQKGEDEKPTPSDDAGSEKSNPH